MQALSERLDALLAGATLERADLLGFSSLKTYAPTPDDLYGSPLRSVGRRAKYLVWEFDDGNRMVLHLSQAGRLDIEEPPKKTKPRGAVARFTFTTRRRDARRRSASSCASTARSARHRGGCWRRATRGRWRDSGPEPGSEEFAAFIRTSDSRRHLTTDLRDQHVVSGIGRGWGDDILHRAKLSPFASLRSLTPDQREALLAAATDVLAEALELERGRAGRAVGGQAGRPLQGAQPLRRALPDARAATPCAGSRSSPTRCRTARPARRAARCWPTAASPACSSSRLAQFSWRTTVTTLPKIVTSSGPSKTIGS